MTYESLERRGKHGRNVPSFNVGGTETLSPSDKFTVVDSELRAWVGELASASSFHLNSQ
jgi:hypothetical protein